MHLLGFPLLVIFLLAFLRRPAPVTAADDDIGTGDDAYVFQIRDGEITPGSLAQNNND